jgi:plastocyanin
MISDNGSKPRWLVCLWGAPINERISKRLAGLVALLSVVLLMVAPNAGAQRQKMVTVSIRDFYFEPSQLIIEPETTVQWVNESTTQHTVFATSPAGAFLSETLNPGESFTHTFPQRFPRPSPDRSTVQPGTYRYICKIHPDMKGSVSFGEPKREGTTTVEPPPPPPVQQPPSTVQQPSPPPVQQPTPSPVQQPPTVPKTGGLSPLLLICSLAVVLMVAVGVLGWVIRRRSS